MKNNLVTLFLLLLFIHKSGAQEVTTDEGRSRKQSIHFETGFNYPAGSVKESIAIRQNINYYSTTQYPEGSVFSATSGFNLGLRYEYFLPSIRSGLSTGLRFTGYSCGITGFTSGNSDFFYLRYSMDGGDTRFARIKSIKEYRQIISIPVEIRSVFYSRNYFSFYAKAGIEYGIVNLRKGSDIVFREIEMETYEEEIISGISVPASNNYATLYGSVGLSYGKENKPVFSIEILIPSLFLTKNNFSMIDTDYYEGFKVSVQFPIINKK